MMRTASTATSRTSQIQRQLCSPRDWATRCHRRAPRVLGAWGNRSGLSGLTTTCYADAVSVGDRALSGPGRRYRCADGTVGRRTDAPATARAATASDPSGATRPDERPTARRPGPTRGLRRTPRPRRRAGRGRSSSTNRRPPRGPETTPASGSSSQCSGSPPGRSWPPSPRWSPRRWPGSPTSSRPSRTRRSLPSGTSSRAWWGCGWGSSARPGWPAGYGEPGAWSPTWACDSAVIDLVGHRHRGGRAAPDHGPLLPVHPRPQALQRPDPAA